MEVHQNEKGEVHSSHRPLTTEDDTQMRSWPSSGLVQVAHALFIESLRREAYTMCISQLSTGTSLESLTASQVDKLVRAHVQEMMVRFSPAVAESVLKGF